MPKRLIISLTRIDSFKLIVGLCLGASKIFYTYLLPCFLLETTKKIIFQSFNFFLAFQNKWNF
jgi:hypothetical protein